MSFTSGKVRQITPTPARVNPLDDLRWDRHGRRITGLVAIVAALAAGTWWFTSAHALGEVGVSTAGPAPMERSSYLETWIRPAGTESMTVDLTSVRANIRQNSAHATTEVVVCAAKAGSVPYAGRTNVSERCTRVEPWRPGQQQLSPTRELMLKVTAAKPGVVVVDNYTVTYWDGFRHGRQRVGLEATLRFGYGVVTD